MKKKLLAILLCGTMILGLSAAAILAVSESTAYAEEATIVATGNAGPDATWTIDSDGLMTISGTGEIYWDDDPAYMYKIDRYTIKKCIIEDGITKIGFCAMENSTKMTEVSIPESVTEIGAYAFNRCMSLTQITLPDSVNTVGHCAFSNCFELESITCACTLDFSIAELTDRIETVSIHNHSITSYTSNNDATCTTDGTKTGLCLRCRQKITIKDEGSATGHTVVKDAIVQPTVFAKGKTAGTHCSVCGKVLSGNKTIAKLTPKLKLSATTKTIKKGKYYKLTISGLANGDSVKTVTSSKKSVATVSKVKTNQYKITAKTKGQATITVKLASGKTATCKVTVK